MKLRVKDLDFDYQQVVVRRGKGQKDRLAFLPPSLEPSLRRQLSKARATWTEDLEAGYGALSNSSSPPLQPSEGCRYCRSVAFAAELAGSSFPRCQRCSLRRRCPVGTTIDSFFDTLRVLHGRRKAPLGSCRPSCSWCHLLVVS